MQATSVQDAQIRTLLPEKNECLPAVLQLGHIHTMFLGLVFHYRGGVLILAYLEMSAGRGQVWRKAGGSFFRRTDFGHCLAGGLDDL
jgi:hypothetical protein